MTDGSKRYVWPGLIRRMGRKASGSGLLLSFGRHRSERGEKGRQERGVVVFAREVISPSGNMADPAFNEGAASDWGRDRGIGQANGINVCHCKTKVISSRRCGSRTNRAGHHGGKSMRAHAKRAPSSHLSGWRWFQLDEVLGCHYIKINAMQVFQFTSESVSEGHPDKIADQVSDAILDAYLAQDPDARVACECLITRQQLVVAGEISSSARVDAIAVARDVIRRIGYADEAVGFDCQSATYTNLLHQQSPEIGNRVAQGDAGDQGMMFGYACRETPEYMPLPMIIAHALTRRQSELRNSGEIDWLLPDAKSQVTVRYDGHMPVAIEAVVLSTQHRPGIHQEVIRDAVIRDIITPVLSACELDSDPQYFINPSGSFTIGGPLGDTGLTGRKIIVDTYGGMCTHGGGAFSGKDPSKLDRSGAYAARYVAKHLVAAGWADRCTVQISYAIGRAEPISLLVDFQGTGRFSETDALDAIRSTFDLTPQGIVSKLELKRPIYLETAAYGHFGRQHFPWEVLDNDILAALARL